MSAFRDRVVSAQQAPPGYWDSDSLHATPQRHHIGTFRRLLRDELMQVADQAAQDDVEKVEIGVLYLRSLGVRGGFTPSTRVVSRRACEGWSLLRF